MTGKAAVTDDLPNLRRILTETEGLLLDFDGPICSVFAQIPAQYVADQLRGALRRIGHAQLPPHIEEANDPFDIFRYAATLGPEVARYVEALLQAHEVKAVGTAEPTPGSGDFIQTWHNAGRKLAVVSNNSLAAVKTYLSLHGLAHCVDTVAARTEPDPGTLKPDTHLLQQAAESIMASPSRCTLVGDSLTDLQAANMAGSRAIGFANKAGKVNLFTAANPNAIITRMDVLTEAAIMIDIR